MSEQVNKTQDQEISLEAVTKILGEQTLSMHLLRDQFNQVVEAFKKLRGKFESKEAELKKVYEQNDKLKERIIALEKKGEDS